MPSVAEISYFKASEGYVSGSVSLDEPLARISKASGLKRSYIGFEIEDPTILFWVNDWVTKDACDAFAQQADDAGTAAASHPAFGSEPTINYVEFEDTNGPLGAPITELVTLTPKEGKSIPQLMSLLQELHQKIPGTPRFHGDSWGLVIGNPNVYHGILGWDSVEAHREAVSGGPLKEVLDRIRLVADLWRVHAALKPHSV